ncbi:hypothetical protein Q5P01_022123 [Channa striata]|uniref:Uncharacterized protein n=1 Tax=Channa striata TaxID=64152 RepID=A0AA88LLK9_CHASR|nr:hypothetical protein Q5P01_022123 [Channa striata]
MSHSISWGAFCNKDDQRKVPKPVCRTNVPPAPGYGSIGQEATEVVRGQGPPLLSSHMRAGERILLDPSGPNRMEDNVGPVLDVQQLFLGQERLKASSSNNSHHHANRSSASHGASLAQPSVLAVDDSRALKHNRSEQVTVMSCLTASEVLYQRIISTLDLL